MMNEAKKEWTKILNDAIADYFIQSSTAIEAITNNLDVIARMTIGIYESQLSGGKLLIGGNGGSCADAEHFAAEMTCTFNDPKRRAFSAISLTNNSSAITAWSNDFGYDSYFTRQVEAFGNSGDILFLITTGGGDRVKGFSMNLVHAAEKALQMGLKLYAIAGKTGGELSKMSHEFIKISSFATSVIQEAHIVIIHAICIGIDKLASSNLDIKN